jgi:predicted TIM-barrel fold metal-dependent hydrolase
VQRWHAASPTRVIPAVSGLPPIDSVRAWVKGGTIQVLGELMIQAEGIAPTDSIAEAYFALAEELDIPVGVHVGPSSPCAAFFGLPNYRARLSNPLLFAEVLIRPPKLRLYLMHAGWPMIDETIALLYAYPQVNVEVGVVDWLVPRKEFHAYLRRLIDAGFDKRVMFGSDQNIWPETIGIAIEALDSADFLTAQQKRHIFYNNAARFLRMPLPEEQGRGRATAGGRQRGP